MSLATRRILFYSLTLLFIVVGTGLVFYSRGWRFDWKDRELVQIGGIYLRSRPDDARIELDGKAVKNKAGLLQSGTLIGNLFPGEYDIHLSKDGYHDWRKHVSVLPENVSIFDEIIMVPQKEGELVVPMADNFYLQEGDSGRMIIEDRGRLKFNDGVLVGDEVVAFRDNLPVTYETEIKNYYLTDLGKPEARPLNLNDLFTELKTTQLNLPGEVLIIKVYPYPYSSRRFIILTAHALYTLDTERLVVEQIGSEASDFVVAGNDVVWLGPRGISKYNLVFRSHSALGDLSQIGITGVDEIAEIGVPNSGDAISILKNDGELWLWEGGDFSRLRQDVKQAIFSPDSRGLLIQEAGSLKFYDRDEKILISLDFKPEAEIKKTIWYRNNAYVISSDSEERLVFLEINEVVPLNRVLIASGVLNFDYSEGEDALYFIDDEGIKRFSFK